VSSRAAGPRETCHPPLPPLPPTPPPLLLPSFSFSASPPPPLRIFPSPPAPSPGRNRLRPPNQPTHRKAPSASPPPTQPSHPRVDPPPATTAPHFSSPLFTARKTAAPSPTGI